MRARVGISAAMSPLRLFLLLLLRARPAGSLNVVGEEGGHGGPEGCADGGCDGGGAAGGGRSRSLRGERHGGRGGDEDGAGDLLHLHPWMRRRLSNRRDGAAEGRNGGEEEGGERAGCFSAAGWLCAPVALPGDGGHGGAGDL
ncbi:uncharacterized protein [Miscanthus floridulus]|uniref:uncharacterized protein n=1 Tax=Miscanthus floridulus TaxID=154761 RepID=UPI0034598F74